MLAFRVSRQWVRLLEVDGAEVLLSLFFKIGLTKPQALVLEVQELKVLFLTISTAIMPINGRLTFQYKYFKFYD